MNEPTINTFRIIAGIFAMITALGWLWFAGSFSIAWHGYALLMAVAFLVATISPSRVYRSKYKHVIAAIYLIGIVGTIPIIYEDYTLINGADYSAMIIRVIEIVVLGALAREALVTKQSMSNQVTRPDR
jgi:hypothetical protein